MNEALTLFMAGLAGAALGVIFFGGLWWTIHRGVSSSHPAIWFIGSLIVRMSIVLMGIFFVGRGNLQRLLLCLLGFVIARLAVTWITRLPVERQSLPLPEARHAP